MSGQWMALVQMALALGVVAGLIVALAALAKRTGLDRRLRGGKGEAARLHVVETLYLDPRRRLVLVRFDAQEHLLLLGPDGDRVVASQARGDGHVA